MCVPTLRGNTARVDSKGRIVLPKEMREGFEITPGTEVEIREEPYLFDVGVTALAHSDAPVDDAALRYVRRAIAGDIDAVVPHASVVGAHDALTSYYGLSNARASKLVRNFTDARRIHWYDGYYAQVALEEGVETVLTIDDDFEAVRGITAEVILSPGQFETLNDYLGYRTRGSPR